METRQRKMPPTLAPIHDAGQIIIDSLIEGNSETKRCDGVELGLRSRMICHV